MEGLIGGLQRLFEAQAALDSALTVWRSARAIAVLAGLLIVFGVLAAGFAALACVHALPATLPIWQADLIVAAGLLVLALIAGFGLIRLLKPPPRRPALTPEALLAEGLAAAGPLADSLHEKLAKEAPTLAALGFAGGVAIGLLLLKKRR